MNNKTTLHQGCDFTYFENNPKSIIKSFVIKRSKLDNKLYNIVALCNNESYLFAAYLNLDLAEACNAVEQLKKKYRIGDYEI